VATKTAEAAAAAPPPKSKKLLVIVLAVVLFVVLAVLGTIIFVNKQRSAAVMGDEEAQPVARQQVEVGPPTYLPLDNMVVNLADPGGERVAQIGITFELQNAAAVERVKQYLPSIRSGILLLVSQRTSEDLLKIEGKEKLARAILREAAEPFGGMDEDEDEVDASKSGSASKPRKRRRVQPDLPVQRVLFSSFIVQ
jgi:flagellar protein FliL